MDETQTYDSDGDQDSLFSLPDELRKTIRDARRFLKVSKIDAGNQGKVFTKDAKPSTPEIREYLRELDINPDDFLSYEKDTTKLNTEAVHVEKVMDLYPQLRRGYRNREVFETPIDPHDPDYIGYGSDFSVNAPTPRASRVASRFQTPQYSVMLSGSKAGTDRSSHGLKSDPGRVTWIEEEDRATVLQLVEDLRRANELIQRQIREATPRELYERQFIPLDKREDLMQPPFSTDTYCAHQVFGRGGVEPPPGIKTKAEALLGMPPGMVFRPNGKPVPIGKAKRVDKDGNVTRVADDVLPVAETSAEGLRRRRQNDRVDAVIEKELLRIQLGWEKINEMKAFKKQKAKVEVEAVEKQERDWQRFERHEMAKHDKGGKYFNNEWSRAFDPFGIKKMLGEKQRRRAAEAERVRQEEEERQRAEQEGLLAALAAEEERKQRKLLKEVLKAEARAERKKQEAYQKVRVRVREGRERRLKESLGFEDGNLV